MFEAVFCFGFLIFVTMNVIDFLFRDEEKVNDLYSFDVSDLDPGHYLVCCFGNMKQIVKISTFVQLQDGILVFTCAESGIIVRARFDSWQEFSVGGE